MNLENQEFYLFFGELHAKCHFPNIWEEASQGYMSIYAPSYDIAREMVFNTFGKSWSHIWDQETFQPGNCTPRFGSITYGSGGGQGI